MISDFEKAEKYLETFISPIPFRKIENPLYDPLNRMRVFLKFLGNPQNNFKSIIVSGTSGKGSTSHILANILKNAGYKTGLTISPHIQSIKERLQINGKEIPDKKFTEMVNSLVQTIELMRKLPVGKPSYFEILIALAFLYFKKEKVDIAVVEVGIEGKYDATNVLSSLGFILTNISLDHTQILGETVEEIAEEAVGGIKGLRIKDKGLINNSSLIINHSFKSAGVNTDSPQGCNGFVVTGVKQESVIGIVEKRCKEEGAELYLLQKHFDYKVRKDSVEGVIFDFFNCHLFEPELFESESQSRGHQSRRPEFISGSSPVDKSEMLKQVQHDMLGIKLSLRGSYQAENASLAIKAVRQLADFGFKISEKNIRSALSTISVPGRFEIVRGPVRSFPPASAPTKDTQVRAVGSPSSSATPLLILDGAHNPAKMNAFVGELEKLFPKRRKTFIIGFKKDKNIEGMLSSIEESADRIILTEFSRSIDIGHRMAADMRKLKVKSEKLRVNESLFMEDNIEKAIKKAIEITREEDLIIVTGSLYLVGEARSLLLSGSHNKGLGN